MNYSTPQKASNGSPKNTIGGQSHHNTPPNGTMSTGTGTGTGTGTTTTPVGSHPNGGSLIRGLILCSILINFIHFKLYGSYTPQQMPQQYRGSDLPLDPPGTTPAIEAVATFLTDTPRMRRRTATQTTTSLPVVPQRRSILVTGGAGFVGSHVVEYLLNLQQPNRRDEEDDGNFLYDIVIIDEVNDYYDTTIKESNILHLMNVSKSLSQQQQLEPISLHFYRGDICNTTLLDLIFTQHNIASICHMAARAGVRPSIDNPYVYIHSNIIGTITLLQYAVQYQIQNFVFASSSSVYGGSTSTYFTETEPVDHPISPYAATKKACELFSYMYSFHHQLNITALRFFTVYGPRGRPDMAPYKFIRAISNHIPIQQYGDGTSSRDYTYISDIVSGVIKSLLHHPSRYSIYNLGKGNGTTLNDFVHYVETYVNTSATIQLLPDQPGDVPYTCANISMAQLDLRYQPMVPFPNGIQQTVHWYQQRQVQQQQQLLVSSSDNTKNGDRRRLLSQHDSPAMMGIPFDDEMLDTIPRMEMQNEQQRRRLQQQTPVVSPLIGYKKIAMSGAVSANEFVGRHVVETLLRRGDDVVLIDDDDDTAIHSTSLNPSLSYINRMYGDSQVNRDTTWGKLSIYLGDRNNSTFLEQVFYQEQPTHVFHFGLDKYTLATLSSFDTDDGEFERSKIYVKKNVEILVRLLEVSKHGGKTTTNANEYTAGTLILKDKIQNFVFTSSDAVYGYEAASTKKDRDAGNSAPSNDIERLMLWNETDRVDYPKSSYGASMKSAELLGYTYHHLYNIPTSILRLFNIYGPYQTPKSNPSHQLFDTVVDEKSNDESESMMSDDNPWDTFDFSSMDYTYIVDIVQGIVSSIDRPYEYEIFNLGSGNDNCIKGITNLMRKIATEISLPEVTTEKILNGFQESLSLQSDRLVDGISCANIQKARDLLQYSPDMTTSLSYSITKEWHDSLILTEENNTLPSLFTGKAPFEHLVSYNDTSDALRNSDITIAIATESNATAKPCPAEVIVVVSSYPNYPHWLRQLAFIQWLIVVAILIFRFLYRLRVGSSSQTISSLLQQQPQSPTRESRGSPKREHV